MFEVHIVGHWKFSGLQIESQYSQVKIAKIFYIKIVSLFHKRNHWLVVSNSCANKLDDLGVQVGNG